MNERLEAIVYGRVQLVMYRDFSMRKARGLKLVGEVQNLRDKTVRVGAEGPRDRLEMFVSKLERGPILARVDSVVPTWQTATGEYTRFDINYD